jgi:hypothetical protein
MRAALRQLQQVLSVAQAEKDPTLLAMPASVIGRTLVAQGQFAQALPILTDAIRALEEIHDSHEWILAIGFRAVALTMLGDYAAGLVDAERALAQARESNTLTGKALAHGALGMTYLFGNDLRTAISHARAMIDTAAQSASHPLVAALILVERIFLPRSSFVLDKRVQVHTIEMGLARLFEAGLRDLLGSSPQDANQADTGIRRTAVRHTGTRRNERFRRKHSAIDEIRTDGLENGSHRSGYSESRATESPPRPAGGASDTSRRGVAGPYPCRRRAFGCWNPGNGSLRTGAWTRRFCSRRVGGRSFDSPAHRAPCIQSLWPNERADGSHAGKCRAHRL